ncbi:MAG: FAD-dependent monooxygenase [Propionibacteriaceae bacterium]|jgi:putative polyketide hydroxylase
MSSSDLADVDQRDAWPVIVVGAGPAGLVAAITLARAGIRVRVVNRQASVFAHPRATVVSLRSMELFRSWGLEEELWSGGDDVEWRMLVTATLSEATSGQLIEVGYPSRSQSARLSPTRPAAVPQDHLEAVLIKYLQSLAAARVDLGVAVEDLWPGENGLRVKLRGVDSGISEVAETRYVIGADGVRSLVRQRLGVTVASTDELLHSFSAVIRAPLWEIVDRQRYGIYMTQTPARGTFLPAGQGDRWVYGFSWDPRVEQMADLSENELIARIRVAAGVSDMPVRLIDQRRFTFSAALADRFRAGNGFLIGDAAHHVTPRGGTGMNSAIGDGFNLAWKLSWVLKDWASDSLLDTYQAERRPVAEHNLARSLDPMGSRRRAQDELRFDLGDRLPHVWIDSPAGRVSSLDLLGQGLTRLSVDQSSPQVSNPSHVPPITEHHLDALTAAALGADQPGGVLLRPDGVVWVPPLSAALNAA